MAATRHLDESIQLTKPHTFPFNPLRNCFETELSVDCVKFLQWRKCFALEQHNSLTDNDSWNFQLTTDRTCSLQPNLVTVNSFKNRSKRMWRHSCTALTVYWASKLGALPQKMVAAHAGNGWLQYFKNRSNSPTWRLSYDRNVAYISVIRQANSRNNVNFRIAIANYPLNHSHYEMTIVQKKKNIYNDSRMATD